MTTKEKIAVMQAYADGKQIQERGTNECNWRDVDFISWNWEYNVYRIKPEPTKPTSWEEYCKNATHEGKFYIDESGKAKHYCSYEMINPELDKATCCSKEEAEAFVAMMQLRLLRKAWIGGWEADWMNRENKYCIERYGDYAEVNGFKAEYHSLSFPTEEMAEDFLNCFGDLLEIAREFL